MGAIQLLAIVDALIAAGMSAGTPAAVTSCAHTPSHRQLLFRLGVLAETVGAQGLASPAIVVIGDVVRVAPMWPELRVDTARPPPLA